MKLVWDVPRSTHTYLVDNFLATNHLSVKNQLLSRYVNFFRSLLKVLANIASRDVRLVTGKNLHFIERESGLDPWKVSSANVRDMLPNSKVPAADMWRLPLLVPVHLPEPGYEDTARRYRRNYNICKFSL